MFVEAERLLLRICQILEDERDALFPAVWYYEQLAIIYRKQGRLADELAILLLANRRHPETRRVGRLGERLQKLLGRHGITDIGAMPASLPSPHE